MIHSCSKCSYTTDCKSNFNRHIRKKIPCGVSIKYTELGDDLVRCNDCLKNSTKHDFVYHLKKCKGIPVNACEFCNTLLKSRQSKCNHRKTCKARTTTSPDPLPQPVSTNSNTGNVTNIYNFYETNNNYQQVIVFGNEDVRYLRDKQAVDERYLEAVKSFPSMLDLFYFNADHEENHTVRKRTKKSNMIEFRHGDSWVGEGTETAIPKLLAQMQQKITEAFGDAGVALSMDVPKKPTHMTECLHNRTDRGLTVEGNIVSPFNFPPIRTDQATWTKFVDAMLHRFYHENVSWMTRDMFKGFKETIVRELKEIACGEEYNIEHFTMYRDGLKLYDHFLSLYPEF